MIFQKLLSKKQTWPIFICFMCIIIINIIVVIVVENTNMYELFYSIRILYKHRLTIYF